MNSVKPDCWGCKKSIFPEDRYCKFCGRGQGKYAAWYYHHLGVILLTLFALGPFAIYFVLRSPIIGRRVKWVYAILIILMTVYIAKFVYHIYLLTSEFLSWF